MDNFLQFSPILIWVVVAVAVVWVIVKLVKGIIHNK